MLSTPRRARYACHLSDSTSALRRGVARGGAMQRVGRCDVEGGGRGTGGSVCRGKRDKSAGKKSMAVRV